MLQYPRIPHLFKKRFSLQAVEREDIRKKTHLWERFRSCYPNKMDPGAFQFHVRLWQNCRRHLFEYPQAVSSPFSVVPVLSTIVLRKRKKKPDWKVYSVKKWILGKIDFHSPRENVGLFWRSEKWRSEWKKKNRFKQRSFVTLWVDTIFLPRIGFLL